MNFNRFIKMVKSHCRINRVKFKLENKSRVIFNGSGSVCAGYFDQPNNKNWGEIVVAKRNSSWKNVLLHEYCHMLQYLDGFDKKIDFTILHYEDLSRIEEEDPDIEEAIEKLQLAEYDCEARTISLIHPFGLYDYFFNDTTDYILFANAYILSHNWVKKNRQWLKLKYSIEHMTGIFPDKFISSDKIGRMTKKQEAYFDVFAR